MNAEIPAPKRPIFGVTSILFLLLQIAIPIIGYQLTASAIDNSHDESEIYVGLFLIITGLVGVLIVLALVGFVGAIAGGIALARGERRRWTGWIGLFGGGLTFATTAGSVLYLYIGA